MKQEEDGKFPPLFNNFINKEYVLTIDVSEENLKLNSEVYQISDVQMDVEEKLSDLENFDNLSEEAEDDLTIQVHDNFLMITAEYLHNYSNSLLPHIFRACNIRILN